LEEAFHREKNQSAKFDGKPDVNILPFWLEFDSYVWGLYAFVGDLLDICNLLETWETMGFPQLSRVTAVNIGAISNPTLLLWFQSWFIDSFGGLPFMLILLYLSLTEFQVRCRLLRCYQCSQYTSLIAYWPIMCNIFFSCDNTLSLSKMLSISSFEFALKEVLDIERYIELPKLLSNLPSPDCFHHSDLTLIRSKHNRYI
jgi:hypothetical protein